MDGLERTVEMHKDRVFRFAYCFLGDRAEAEDVTQEVLVRLWRSHAKVDGSRLGAWLMRVTRNLCIDAVRARTRERALMAGERALRAIEASPAAARQPESAVELSELAERVKRALEVLAEPYRTVVVLREIQGMSYDELSEALGMPLNTIKVYLHRARRRLRDELREAGHP